MLTRRELFPNVIEMNFQARRRFGCCVYLVFSDTDWALVDIGYEDTVQEIIDLIRDMDFPLANCRYLIATHADADHVQGLKRAAELLPAAETVAHPDAKKILENGDRIASYAEIPAQQISIDMPTLAIAKTVKEGDVLSLGDQQLEVWDTPGHATGQLSFRFGDLLLSGDNIFRDGCVGGIDAHHGSDIPEFIASLKRIQSSDVKWLLPSHGPAFKNDHALLQSTIDRLDGYQHMADFGTCAVDWPLLDEWDDELAKGTSPE
ncbi:MBL fold metallo-hydrolase [Fuerstiella marisgermanici]|uniref:Putative polyketide biosynthesis zinc-dependent hydrolase PksB n=1 Tax=Fuerstiella marisgermanici TaxID=1891926 RepID=A0A1P8WK86_9PLAN|nr:MBL fold metallo-hydrolase [Fuerstiella marisgermanici]APZ94463.1 putative polyketide biosynthesis zinc-dependent hydrolase PksB [Fuerstiella marisgermanici]